jgi:DMSO/TMAO reductase YedYZ heme-binding membrane subunit
MTKNNALTNWTLGVCGLSLGLMFWLFGLAASDESVLLWARYTARLSCFLFLLSFSASALHHFFANGVTTYLRQHRRALGLSFALAHIIHLVALISFFVTSGEAVDRATLVVGGFGYVLVVAMAITSNDKAVQKLGAKRWKRLHWWGAHYIALVFFITYLGRLADGRLGNLVAGLLVAIMVAAFALRAAHSVSRGRVN